MDFKILGPLEVLDGERPVALGGARQRALLTLLLLHANEVVSNERLLADLWGDDGHGAKSSKALPVAISRLRRALEPQLDSASQSRVLLTRATGYELRIEPGRLDVQRFEAGVANGRRALAAGQPAVAAERLAEALALWRGPALADVRYEQFAQGEIARLEDLRAAALEDRISADLQLGRHGLLLGELEQLVAEHPYRERLTSALMTALYRSGRQADALDAYRRTRRLLVEELGIEPGRELKELERAILAQDAALDGPQPSTEPLTRGPFVGREREMTELLAALEAARAGAGAVVLVGGEPGAGKSRLAEELAAHARDRGMRVLVGRCWEAGGAPPYWPWVQLLRSYVRETDGVLLRAHLARCGSELVTLVPDLADVIDVAPSVAPAAEGARFLLFDAVAGFLKSAARGEPLAVVLDDLHAADEPSLLLLRFVAAELASARILIVGCFRDSEVRAGHPLADALPELARQRSVRRIALRGIGRADVGRLLELTTGHAAPIELTARVHDATNGNPLFAAQIAHLLHTEGPGERTGAAYPALPIPDAVRDVIRQRLQRQSDTCRRVLTHASVLGREFALDALEALSDLTQDDLHDALDEAVEAHLVSDVPGSLGRLRFSHMLIRDVLHDDLPVTRSRGLHRAAAEALEALHAADRNTHAAEIAEHYLAAGAGAAPKALEHSVRAGDFARLQLAYEEAARHYRTALHLLDTLPADAQSRCEVYLSLGDVLSRAGDSADAKGAFRTAAAIAEQAGLREPLARAALDYGGRFLWARGGSDAALVPLLERALAAVGEQDAGARVRLLARLASALRDQPSRERRVALADEALQMARRHGDLPTLTYALEACWVATYGPDNVERRLEQAMELVSLAEQTGEQERLYAALEDRLWTLWELGDRAGVDVALESLTQLAADLRQPAQIWHARVAQTTLSLLEGRFADAEELIAAALDAGDRAQRWNALLTQRVQTFMLRREQGRLHEVEHTIRRAVHEYPAMLGVRCILIHLDAALGHHDPAREQLHDVLGFDLARNHIDDWWLFALSLLTDPCAALADSDAAARLYELLQPYERLNAVAPGEASVGSVARGLGVLATTLRRFDRAQQHLEVALEMNRRMQARPWLAHTQHDLGAMLLTRNGLGDCSRARELLAEASSRYRALGMQSWAHRALALIDAGNDAVPRRCRRP